MASAHDIAALMIAGLTPPSGNGDIGFHQGVVLSWDELSGVNTLAVNNSTISNVKTLQSGVGISYFIGDVVGLLRFQSTYFILGKIGAPGGTGANQIKSAAVAAFESTGSTSYTNLATGGPTATATIGSSRRCLVMLSATAIGLATASSSTGQYIGGTASFDVSGASTIGAGAYYCGGQTWYASTAAPTGIQIATSSVALLTSAQGLNPGSNTFTMRYRSVSSNTVASFADRSITVIPF